MAALTLLSLASCTTSRTEAERDVARSARAPEPVESAPRLGPHLPIVVSRQSIDSTDPHDVIQSNLAFIVTLTEARVREDEISEEALMSADVEYYHVEMSNGGFSQFVYNSRGRRETNDRVARGLRAIGAARHLALFERCLRLLDELGAGGLERYLAREYWGDNADRDALGALDSEFFTLAREELLVELNAAWIRGRPNLRVLTLEEMQAEVAAMVAAIPDPDARAAAARAGESRETRLIRGLCEATGQTLDRVTGGDPAHRFEGSAVVAWHFITDRGHHYMVEHEGRAMMFDDGGRRIATIDALATP